MKYLAIFIAVTVWLAITLFILTYDKYFGNTPKAVGRFPELQIEKHKPHE